jgi:hypothetical protein
MLTADLSLAVADAALGGSPVAERGDYGWSPAYQDVLDLRAEVERLRGGG